MSKKIKTDNKQNKKIDKKLNNESKRRFGVIGFTSSIILLLLILIIVLKVNANGKSETVKIMKRFSEFYSSNTPNVILYYDSKETSNDNFKSELEYLNQLSKDYKIKFLAVDYSVLNEKNKKEVELKLGIDRENIHVAVVKEKQVLGIHNGYMEEVNLVDFLIDTNVLEEGSKYSKVDNLKFISYDDYKSILEKKEKNIIVVGQTGCAYCKAAKPILNNISKAYKVDIYYLNLSDMNRNDALEFFDVLPKIGYDDKSLEEDGSFSTPTILIVKKGKVVSYLKEHKSLDEYIAYLKDNKVIE